MIMERIYSWQVTPDCAVGVDEAGCVVLDIAVVGVPVCTVTVTNVAEFVNTLNKARDVARIVTDRTSGEA